MARQPYVAPVDAPAPRVLDQPQPGLWMVRLVSGGPEVPAMIERRPHEPGNPENELDRSPRSLLHAEIDGAAVDVDAVWNRRGRAIDRAEYDYQIAIGRHAKAYLPKHPRAEPRSRIDLLTVPLPFSGGAG